MKLTEFIHPGAILVDLKSTDRDGVIAELIESLVAAGAIKSDGAEELRAALIKREKSGSTGFGKGVAVPHAKHAKVEKLVGAVGLSKAGVDFKALDQKPVHAVFMLLSPQGQDQAHLQAMEVVFRSLNKEMFRRFLRQSDTVAKVIDLLGENDAG
jgi:PTS system fructose-specific IIA component/PTS system nitrogen regulatory IIA component